MYDKLFDIISQDDLTQFEKLLLATNNGHNVFHLAAGNNAGGVCAQLGEK